MPKNCIECADKFICVAACKERLEQTKPCPDCGGNGYLVVKHDGEPDDYHDCQRCDCSGEVPL